MGPGHTNDLGMPLPPMKADLCPQPISTLKAHSHNLRQIHMRISSHWPTQIKLRQKYCRRSRRSGAGCSVTNGNTKKIWLEDSKRAINRNVKRLSLQQWVSFISAVLSNITLFVPAGNVGFFLFSFLWEGEAVFYTVGLWCHSHVCLTALLIVSSLLFFCPQTWKRHYPKLCFWSYFFLNEPTLCQTWANVKYVQKVSPLKE